MKIENLVRTDFEVISPEVMLSDLDELLTNNSYLAVYDQDVFLGILSAFRLKSLTDRPAKHSLDDCPEIEIDTKIEKAAKLMQAEGCAHAKVFKGGRFIGMLLFEDLVTSLLNHTSHPHLSSNNPARSQHETILKQEKEITECRELVRSFTQYKQSIEKILKNKSDLLADVSHEIRNPMHIILSYARQGMQKVDTEKDKLINRYFSRIHDAGEKVLLLINDLLDLSKLESGKTRYEFENCDLSELVATVLDEYQLILESKQMTYYFKRPDFECSTKMDKNRMLQVIRNLVSNAYKFSPEESHIRIELDIIDNELHFSIIDWGFGIPEKGFDDLFKKYSRTSKKDIKGTGLGLSIAYNIINDHKGTLYAKPNPEGGSIFTFTLPM